MKFLKELTNNDYLTEEDNSAIPEKSIKDLQSMIRKGVENSGEWSNALEVVHKAYDVLSIQRPTPDMKGAWKQYETLISYSVDQLAKVHGQNGTWRMTSEDFEESPVYSVELIQESKSSLSEIKAQSPNEIIEYFESQLHDDNITLKENIIDKNIVVEFWQYDTIKTKSYLVIKPLS